MKARYSSVTVLLTILLSSGLLPAFTFAFADGVSGFRKPGVSIPPRDSIVTVDSLGGVSVRYIYQALTPTKSNVSIRQDADSPADESSEKTEAPAKESLSDRIRQQSSSHPELTSYFPGSIPIESSVSAIGARLYNVPIITAAGWKLSPSVSLSYNSLSGNGVAGYGWGISGLSSISVRNGNLYYDSLIRAGIYDSSDALYSLDGMPLVQSETGISEYSLSTARGKVQIRKHALSSGCAAYFEAMYPNGQTATFGYSDNIQPRSHYPITELKDADGNTITFTYTLIQNCYYIEEIDYGDGASISFTYIHREDDSLHRFSGTGIYSNPLCRLLVGITSTDGSETLCHYVLSHETVDGVPLLKTIRSGSGPGELPPLTFSYGADEVSGDPPAFIPSGQSMFLKYFTKSDSLSLLHRRGRFLPGNPNDGVVVLPSYETYAIIDRNKEWYETNMSYLYGSAYSPDQEILCNLTGYYSSLQKVITAGEGFQLVEAVDVDGDGIDELVKINNSSPSSGSTSFRITTYSFDEDGNHTSSYFDILVNDGVSNSHFNSPAQCSYRFGNFRGDGRMMLLIITYPQSRLAIVDMNSGSKLTEAIPFSLNNGDEDKYIFTADLENDGKTDLCHLTSSGLDVYSLDDLSGVIFRHRTTYSGVNIQSLCSASQSGGSSEIVPCRIVAVDLNSDGYQDLVSYPMYSLSDGSAVEYSTVNVGYFDGKQFQTEAKTPFNRLSDEEIILLDADKDGLPDMLHVEDSVLNLIRNDRGDFPTVTSPYASITVDGTSDVIPGDISIFGDLGSLMVMSGPYVRLLECSVNHDTGRKLVMMTDSFGNQQHNTYESTAGYSGVYQTDAATSYNSGEGFALSRIPLNLLTESRTVSGILTVKNESYLYWDAAYHSRGLGFCGFRKIRIGDLVNGVYETRVLDPQKFGILMERSLSKSQSGSPYYTEVNYYDGHTTTYGKLAPRLMYSEYSDNLTGVSWNKMYNYDSQDFPILCTTRSRIGSSAYQSVKVERTYNHGVYTSVYLLGSVAEETVTRETDGVESESWKERSVFTYDDSFRPTRLKKYVGVSGQELVCETRWTYDSNGNVASEKSAPYGATEFLGDTYTYDSDGRHLLSRTDALGRTTTYSGYNKFGKPSGETDHWGRSTSYTYDLWGNLIRTVYPDGTESATAISWGGTGLYTVTMTTTGVPETITHYDALGREVRSGVKRFDGQWQYTDKEYNSRGLLQRESLPYRGSSASLWNTYSYDTYNRPTAVTEASGRTTTWSYNGTSVTTVKDGISSISATDALGNIIRVTDPGGTLSYSFRDDGQPLSVTAPGDIVTTFSYDSFGRRTSITDPSAGTRSESFVWNSDGSHSVTDTNPNGSLTTNVDKYGRTVSVGRSGEFTTTYSYDSHGRLSEEQSGNGTSRVYTYDSYDRLLTVKDSVPDGKWLQRSYTYDSDGNVATISFATQNGALATESYSYSNGHKTGISLVGGPTVWSLTSENDLGQITSYTSGGVSCEKGFSASGLPTERKLGGGTLQHFVYQFAPQTGNLTMRRDAVNDRSESFTYDALNRLVSTGSGNITYDTKGNLTSIGGVGTMSYGDASHPYQITSLQPVSDSLVSPGLQNISYTGFDRPSAVSEGGRTASFTYNGDGARVRMSVSQDSAAVLTRYYIGGRYELDQAASGSVERFYVGGGPYSAPMVLRRENGGEWTAYVIGRDHLGSITHILSVDGTKVAEYSYDPWGRLRNPQTHETYPVGNEPQLLLGRGFTGHEHLPYFGLVNMNARLYDPLLGRFLSPDPYVQMPDFTQSFNRYTYGLNNPLVYTDPDGEFWHIVVGGLFGGIVNLAANWDNIDGFWEGLAAFGVGAGTGALTALTGGVAGASLWATAGVAAAGSAVTMGTNSIIVQTGNNFSGNVDWGQVGISSAVGAVSGFAGAAAGYWAASSSTLVNGINSPLLKSAVVSPISAAAGQVSGGTAAGLIQGQSFGEAFKASFDGVVKSMAVGGALGMISTVAVSYANKINPFTGERQYTFKSVGAKRLPTNLKKLSDSYIKKNGINAHDIKKEYLGKNAIISHFDLYQSQSGQIFIFKKNSNIPPIPTYYNIKNHNY